jgi:hypothetical protein
MYICEDKPPALCDKIVENMASNNPATSVQYVSHINKQDHYVIKSSANGIPSRLLLFTSMKPMLNDPMPESAIGIASRNIRILSIRFSINFLILAGPILDKLYNLGSNICSIRNKMS